ncbi:MAG: hypothetical protein FWE94_01915, partial [Coriobacteriia bacterium]|nr:hypothetical protein [Coriobacteriia bacterium]
MPPPQPPSLEGAVGGLYLFMFVGTLFLVYTAFSFLNKRNSSDFFHALPDTRSCMYVTTWAAIASWIFFTVAESVLLTWLAHVVTGMPFIAAYVPLLLLMFFISSLLVASTATVAVSLTGTQ